MAIVSKAKCENGHFFNMAKFECCPQCGAKAAGLAENARSRKPAEFSRRSCRSEMDKTEIMEPGIPETAPQHSAGGSADGYMWEYETPKNSADTEKPAAEEKTADAVPVKAPASENQGRSALAEAVKATGSGRFGELPKTVAHYDLSEEVSHPTGWLVCIKGKHQGEVFPCVAGKNRIGRNPDNKIKPLREESISRKTHAIITYEPTGRKFYLENGDGDGLVYYNGEMLFTHAHKLLQPYDQVKLNDAVFVFVPLCGEQFSWDDYKD